MKDGLGAGEQHRNLSIPIPIPPAGGMLASQTLFALLRRRTTAP